MSSGETLRVRVLVVLVAVGVAVMVWSYWRALPPDVAVFDLTERAALIRAESPEGNSLVDWYYGGPHGSAHLHVIGKGTTCELHIHEHSEEATVPVVGAPIVTQRFGEAGVAAGKSGQYAEGTLIVSPPHCAHEWVNPSPTDDHASLVFTLGDSFPGNDFVAADDPRILLGAAPTVVDTHGDLATFLDSQDRFRSVEVPVQQGSAEEILVKDSFVVAGRADAVTFLYAVAGSGRLQGTPTEIALHPSVLVVLRKALDLTIVADPAEPLAVYVVRIATD